MGVKIKPVKGKKKTEAEKKADIEKRAKARLAKEKAAQAEEQGYRSVKAMDKKRIRNASKASKQEEKTKRIAIRQGEKTARVKARHGVSMKKDGASKKTKTYTRQGSAKSTDGQTTKVYRKDGSLKRETNVNLSGKRTVYSTSGNPRFLDKTTTTSTEKVPATSKTTKYNRKGEAKKTIYGDSDSGRGLDTKKHRKVLRKTRMAKNNAKKKDVVVDRKSGASAKFPEIKKENEGKFTKWVEKNMGGMDTCKAASKIMRSRTKKYSPAVVKMANYANNFGCKTKKEDGASVPLKGKQKNLPDALKSKILASDGPSMKNGKVKDIKSKKYDRKMKKADPGSVKKDVYFPLTGKHGEENRPRIALGDPGSVTSKRSTTFTKGNKKYTKTHNSGSGVTHYSKKKMKK